MHTNTCTPVWVYVSVIVAQISIGLASVADAKLYIHCQAEPAARLGIKHLIMYVAQGAYCNFVKGSGNTYMYYQFD